MDGTNQATRKQRDTRKQAKGESAGKQARQTEKPAASATDPSASRTSKKPSKKK